MGKNTDLIYSAMSEGVRTASEFAQYKKGYRMNSNSMISKELLSEVLSIPIEHITKQGESILCEPNKVIYRTHGRNCTKSINIYELAHKYKEWAWDNYSLIIHSGRSIFDKNLYISRVMDTDGKNIKLQGFQADTEPEAIFKACEWILEQKRVDDDRQ